MKREILFKAKRKDNGEWVEGYMVKYPSGKVEIFKKCVELPDVLLRCEVDPKTICEYTGLKDKNGKKIWENDILRRDGYWDIRIEFENGVFMVRNTDKVQYINRVVYTPISIFDINVYEVIGNIFGNPELLEVR
ncbi:hypothetical protein HMPREF1216_00464 [Coprococcus sp. HPP0048]|nr:hypothetical protein HMPREF1216_00464 [Coprococcus sp. HPP0048]